MTRHLRILAAVIGLLIALSAAPAALAQKSGGILRQYIIDSPASMSIHEETTVVARTPDVRAASSPDAPSSMRIERARPVCLRRNRVTARSARSGASRSRHIAFALLRAQRRP
jgi:hypothetical protein